MWQIWCDCDLTIRWLILDCHLTFIVSWKSSKSQVKVKSSKSQWKVNWIIDYTLTLAWLSLTETWLPEWLHTWLHIDLVLTLFDWNMTLSVKLKSQNTTSSPGLVGWLYMTLTWLLTDFLFYWAWLLCLNHQFLGTLLSLFELLHPKCYLRNRGWLIDPISLWIIPI